mmetsp:Transcript_157918/g.506484  ORF Transcript_157918/g.506484 Transcript_157918/m.506484 type:complete len:415 (+) Transcript_157918:60-1304(+)
MASRDSAAFLGQLGAACSPELARLAPLHGLPRQVAPARPGGPSEKGTTAFAGGFPTALTAAAAAVVARAGRRGGPMLTLRRANGQCRRGVAAGLAVSAAAWTSPRPAAVAEEGAQPVVLTAQDLPAMERLIHGPGIGWQQTRRDLERLVEEGAFMGMFQASDEGGSALVSMAALRRFSGAGGGAWGWLSFVCTAPAARRRGLARRVVEALLRRAGGDLPVGLYGGGIAVDLYTSLGFETRGEGRFLRRRAAPVAEATSPSAAGAQPELLEVESARFAAVLGRDREVYGTERSRDVLSWLRPPGFGFVLPSGAYIVARPRHPDGAWLGPVVARRDYEAFALLSAALRELDGRGGGPVEMILPAGAPPAISGIAQQLGFEDLGPTTLMVKNGDVPLARGRSGPSFQAFVASGFEYG